MRFIAPSSSSRWPDLEKKPSSLKLLSPSGPRHVGGGSQSCTLDRDRPGGRSARSATACVNQGSPAGLVSAGGRTRQGTFTAADICVALFVFFAAVLRELRSRIKPPGCGVRGVFSRPALHCAVGQDRMDAQCDLSFFADFIILALVKHPRRLPAVALALSGSVCVASSSLGLRLNIAKSKVLVTIISAGSCRVPGLADRSGYSVSSAQWGFKFPTASHF
eukprot:8934771-Pyramimonas_sp.AAC.1